MNDENTHESEPQRNAPRMNSVARQLLMLTAITLLAASSPNVLGQSTQQTPAKPQLGMGVTILTLTEGVDFSHSIEQSMKAIKQNWILPYETRISGCHSLLGLVGGRHRKRS
jgi:hypothetical protein